MLVALLVPLGLGALIYIIVLWRTAVVGGLAGAALVGRSKVWLVQVVVGCALLLAGLLYSLTALGLMPAGGTATSLPPPLMAAAFAMQHSRFGWALFAIHDAEEVAEGLGVPTFRHKMIAIGLNVVVGYAGDGVLG